MVFICLTKVRLWTLPEGGLTEPMSANIALMQEDKRVENVLWNPAADGALAVTTHHTLKIFDVTAQQVLTGQYTTTVNLHGSLYIMSYFYSTNNNSTYYSYILYIWLSVIEILTVHRMLQNFNIYDLDPTIHQTNNAIKD